MNKDKIKILKDTIFNFLLGRKYKLSYIIEAPDWSIKYDGIYITQNLSKSGLLKARTTTSPFGLRNQIVHFGSIYTFLRKNSLRNKPHKSNKVVVTWFHFAPNDSRIKFIKEAQKDIDLFHTSCNITKNNLINLGIHPEKIIVIPLGVDLSLFKQALPAEKKKLREDLNIPKDKVVIGSFQKDGVGWGKGLEPKLIKGPDIFVKVVEKLARDYPIFVLLVGPARGYVKKELGEKGIPYKDIGYLKNFGEVAKYYQALDLCLIASRVEGGPKQILEAWASGIPVVSTKVGMVSDIGEDKEDILLTEAEDIEQLTEKASQVIKDNGLRKKLIINGLEKVQNYSWEKIVERYYKEIYSKLL